MNGHADGGQLLAGEQRGGAELGDVGQHRYVQFLDEALVGRQVVGGLGEDGISARLDIALAALQSRFHTFGLDGIGTGNKEEVGIGPRVSGSLDPVHHLLGGDDFLAGTVAATLGTDLILDVGRCGAGLDQTLDGTLNVEGAGTETGIDVHQQRQIADVGNPAHVDQHILKGIDTQIRQTQRAGSHTAAGQVDGLETGTLGQQRMVGVDGADHLQGFLFCQCLTETLARGLVHCLLPPEDVMASRCSSMRRSMLRRDALI